MKNPADDESMKQLGAMKLKVFYLEMGIQSRAKKIEELLTKINSENDRLEAQGYKPKEIKVTPILGLEL